MIPRTIDAAKVAAVSDQQSITQQQQLAAHMKQAAAERQQHALGEEVQLHVVVHGQCDAGAVQIDHGRRHGDQKVHAEHALPQRLVCALVEICARPELEHGRDRKLSQRVQVPEQGHRQKDADAERP